MTPICHRTLSAEAVPGNRVVTIGSFCIGSRCALWLPSPNPSRPVHVGRCADNPSAADRADPAKEQA